ncbi:Uncharacterised protein [Bordetella pertussis]|nr:Uncharacterised protein [Bordetella pertussis]
MNSCRVLVGSIGAMAIATGASPIMEIGVTSSRTLNFASLNRLGLTACVDVAR